MWILLREDAGRCDRFWETYVEHHHGDRKGRREIGGFLYYRLERSSRNGV